MKQLTMQQLCSFVQEKKKIQNKFVLLNQDDIGSFEKYSFIGFRIILLVVSGKMSVLLNGVRTDVRRNDYLDILEGTIFGFESKSADAVFACIFTTRDFILEVMQSRVPAPKSYLMKLILNPVLHLSDGAAAVMERQMALLANTLEDVSHNYRQELLRLYFRSFALEIGNVLIKEQDWQVPSQVMSKSDILIADFMNLVWKNFKEKRDISFYAKELCISPKHLSRVVKSTLGKTPHEILDREVVAFSMQLLRDHSLLVQQVSDMLHFSDQASFSKFFKKYAGVSPVEFRKTM